MGCCLSAKPALDHEAAQTFVAEQRKRSGGGKVLLVAIKDQNTPGKLCISGQMTPELQNAITSLLTADEQNKKAHMELDKYDAMWDYVWRNTVFTSGHSMMSLQKSYFPRGRLFVQFLDLLAQNGWGLSAAPNFGGVESRDDNGQVTSCVDWPVLVFYKDEGADKFTNKHLFFGVKDSNVPGKLCVAGPLEGKTEDALVSTMQARLPKGHKPIESKKDKYDDDYDVVFRQAKITTGSKILSLTKSYFPRGETVVAILNTVYAAGWRLVAAPNFGGQGDSWPCFILRLLKDTTSQPPELCLASIKDSNVPGKLCVAGPSSSNIAGALRTALARLPKNEKANEKVDEYDEDYDAVVRDVNITTGMAAFSLKLPYFPRCDTVLCVLETMQGLGFRVAACPNFGGMIDSWPTFIFEADREAVNHPPMFAAIKDDNIPGKLNFGGGGIGSNTQFAREMLQAMQTMCGEKVSQGKDDYDATFDIGYRNTVLTSGHTSFSWAKPYFPHGLIVETVVLLLYAHGYKVIGGPNFGNDGLQWPGWVCEKMSAQQPMQAAAVIHVDEEKKE